MLATNSSSHQTGCVTGTLLELIHQGKATIDRWLRENATLRAGLASRSGEAPS